MHSVTDVSIFERNRITEDSLWNKGEQRELLLHRIHAYPAKFPSFLVSKLINHFESCGKVINLVADPFCGCGTSALESLRMGKNFWGCDINPVATLITKAKSRTYSLNYLNELYKLIIVKAAKSLAKVPKYYHDNERVKYWFDFDTIENLYRLLMAIERIVPKGIYRDFFLTGFSNILKPCSRWLTKSIKPQLDPHKISAIPIYAFEKQITMMIKAVENAQPQFECQSKISVVNQNLLNIRVQDSFADAIITSPPYVTSYEYADLHQLSALWLGYTDDYRTLRKGSIGSDHHANKTEDIYDQVNNVARITYDNLKKLDHSRAKSVLNYFYDLDRAVKKIKQIANMGGSIALVIGDTNYKGIPIENAKYLAQSLLENDFKNIQASRRKISYKILTPYRNDKGQFTSQIQGMQVYPYEYILVCEK